MEAAKIGQKRKRLVEKFANRMAFSKFVDTCKDSESVEPTWVCCERTFTSLKEIHQHISQQHSNNVSTIRDEILTAGAPDAKLKALKKATEIECCSSSSDQAACYPVAFTSTDQYAWLPIVDVAKLTLGEAEGQVLLFYKYCNIAYTEHVLNWQKELCCRLELTGKVRIGTEGINATVAGNKCLVQIYVKSMMQHPIFCEMKEEDFKRSAGDQSVFPDGLKVAIYKEIVPMGIDPESVSYKETGIHLKPKEFHKVVEELADAEGREKSVLVDCRNFYESKIGKFEGAVTPDLRKFSYWPEYVDANIKMFQDKKVYMYCTGGIRCERGSAYLKSRGINKVYQLEGGIHKYIEEFPDGHFRGKLFVFDDRYTIHTNGDILSRCRYCQIPWDKYYPCHSKHCHQLVLSCETCRSRDFVTCCPKCKEQDVKSILREECDCTRNRPRIPLETATGVVEDN